MDDDAECGSRNVVEFVARARDRATRALSPRDARAARAHDSIRPSANGASLDARDAQPRDALARGDARRRARRGRGVGFYGVSSFMHTVVWITTIRSRGHAILAPRACDFAPFLATRATATFERAARQTRAVWCERATPVDARSSVARGDARRDRARASGAGLNSLADLVERRFRARGAARATDCARARRDARRVFARHTRAAIAPTRTDALAHYSTTRRTERTARARRRRDPDAVSVDG